MSSSLRKLYCTLANVFIACGIVIFATGFFPRKTFLPGLAQRPLGHVLDTSSSPFDKVIFMVVDALRSDFVYAPASKFAFTHELIRAGAAVPFTGHASAPTVTMPRVKAITTGSVPSFLDVVLNLAETDTSSTLANQDTWLAQIKAKVNGKLIMFGDDTWLKLFPEFFTRADGTTSFFVSDFTEVDNNVTRHLSQELGRDDWSAMILHFLGLDHIGHKSGPSGANMAPKQKEMDSVVRDIYGAMESQPHLKSTLFIVCGDHGMNEAGNHGGSSPGEISTALVFSSPKFKAVFDGAESPLPGMGDFSFYEEVEQSDIVPTISSLLGLPIPHNNLGVVIPRLLEFWTQDRDKLDLLMANARQMLEVARATFPQAFDEYGTVQDCARKPVLAAERMACKWAEVATATESVQKGPLGAHEAIPLVLGFLRYAQEVLSGTASNYNLGRMNAGIAFAVIGVVLAAIPVLATMTKPSFGSIFFSFVALSYGGTMFASSYVEEEHQFWYWALSGWLVVLQCKRCRYSSNRGFIHRFPAIGIALLFGLARRWNQTGQKFAGNLDLAKSVLFTQPWLLWLLVITTYVLIARQLTRRAAQEMPQRQTGLLPVMVCLAAFSFKVTFTAADAPELVSSVGFLGPLVALTSRYSMIGQARVAFLGMGHLLVYSAYYKGIRGRKAGRKDLLFTIHDILSLFLVTQTRLTNIPLYLIFYAQLHLLETELGAMRITFPELTLTSLLFQHSSFFLLGGSNAISSIDLSSAYNGVGGYNVFLVGFLAFVGNWAGPIWWSSATLLFVGGRPTWTRAGKAEALFSQFALLTLFTALGTLAVMVACLLLREHLFVWTVFSPKYLFMVAWHLANHLVVNGLLAYVSVGSLVCAL